MLQAWLAEINEYASEDVVIMLLGNKCDMTNERTVRTEDGARLAKVCSVPRVTQHDTTVQELLHRNPGTYI